MSLSKTPMPTEAPARRFGREIGDAVASGVPVDELTLHLTLMDASKVKRDPDLPLDHISCSSDGMRFLGVRVVEGGVRTSSLNSGGASEAPAAPAAVTPAPAKKTRAKKAKAPGAAS